MKRNLASILLVFAAVISLYADNNLRGRVIVDGNPRQGVVVSDGVNVVTTDSEGEYKMNTKGRQHVFVSLPEDCRLPLKGNQPAIYKLIDFSEGETATADFYLKTAPKATDWTLIAFADVQIGFQKDYEDLRDYVMPAFIDSLSQYKGNVYGISLGDIVWNNPDFYTNYTEQISRARIPFFSVIGNHDHNEKTKGDDLSTIEFRNELGPTYYSLNIGDCHIVVLDNIVYSGKEHRNDYYCGLTDQQLDWLKKDLKHVDKSKTLVIGMHAPAWRRYNKTKMVGADKLYKLVKDFNDVQILTGHMHDCSIVRVAPNITDTNLGAVNGAFWYPICDDGSPQGYGVLRFEGNKLVDKYYKGFREPREYQMNLYAPEEAVLWNPDAKPGDSYDKVALNVWMWEDGWKIEVSEDGGEWATLDPDLDRAPLPARDPGLVKHIATKKGTFKANHGGAKPIKRNDHLFLYKPNDGWKKIDARATDNFGNVYTSTLNR